MSWLNDNALPRIPEPPLKNMDRWITDADGRVIIFHGVNMINKLPPYTLSATGFGVHDAELLASNGINVVRVGVIYSAVEPAPGLYDDKYLADIRETVAMLASHGIMSLIDFHQDGWGPSFVCEGFPEWATFTDEHPIRPLSNFPLMLLTSKAVHAAFDNFWANKHGPGHRGLQDRFAAAWAHTAKTLRGTKGILGWEILNEPFPGSANAEALTAFTQKVVNAIRTEDTEHMIWYEPWVTFDFGVPTGIGQINDPASTRRIGMAFHNYLPVELFGLVWKHAVEHSSKTGDALLLTEFGGITSASLIEKMMNSVDGAMMPALFWAYWCRTPYQITALWKHISSAELGIVYDPTRPLIAGNVSEDKLTALTRPYPMFIAGTPVQWGFASDTLDFNLEYSRTSGAPLKSEITEIFVPKRRYTKGYSVSVTGGKRLPSRNEQAVLILNDTGATTVTVEIKGAS